MSKTMSERDAQIIWLPEHESNPFCRSVTPPKSMDDQVLRLWRKPKYSAKERNYPPHLRRFCVLRLRDYMDPLTRQLDLAERLDMAVLSGYVGRNPTTLEYRRGLIASAESLARTDAKGSAPRGFAPSARQSESMIGFSILGCPGMGKTVTVERVLQSYPQIVEHNLGETITQVPYLKIECPSTGSPKAFCLSFFHALGERLQTDFIGTLKLDRKTGDVLMPYVQHYAYLYALGVLVVDEIQHLRQASQGPEILMNFFVAMSNAIKVPVVLVGTMAALDIFQLDFRSGRRASGIGNQYWDRLQKDAEWDAFIKEMWSYQWTREPTALDEDISEALYDESQGVIDIVIKLFIFTQLRVIVTAEADEEADQSEAMTADLIHEVASQDLRMIAPMIQALRSGDQRAIERFEDLKPLARHLEDTILTITGQPASEIRQRLALKEAAAEAAAASADRDAAVLAILKVSKLSVAAEREILAEVRRRHPSGDIATVCVAAAELAKARDAKPIKPAKRKPADQVVVPGDLRDILQAATAEGRTGYDAFLAAGVVKHPLADLAA